MAPWNCVFVQQAVGQITACQAWAKFPEVKGFSTRNLELNRAWARFWSERAIAKQPVSQSAQIPWGHNRVIVRNCQTSAEALYYLHNTQQHGWSRAGFHGFRPHLRHSRAGGNPISAAGKINSHLRGNDNSQGALNYRYFSIKQLKTEQGNPSTHRHSRADGNPVSVRRKLVSRRMDLMLCKEKDKLIAEYALSDVNKPIGISAYQLTQALPDKLKSSLPSIEEIEAELAKDLGVVHE